MFIARVEDDILSSCGTSYHKSAPERDVAMSGGRCWEDLEERLARRHGSALLVVVTELLKAIANSLAHAEAAEEPVIGMPTVVVDSTTVATIVVAVLAGWS